MGTRHMIAAGRVLAVVAHPDDETLGAGGTLARHAAAGALVHLLMLTDGVGARGSGGVQAQRRAQAAAQAAAALGCQPPRILAFPDNRLDSVALLDIVQAIEPVIAALQPEIVYTHHLGDLNIDHAICHRAVLTACRPQPGHCVRLIFAMEVPSATEWNTPAAGLAFQPTQFVGIEGTLAQKRAALNAYAGELRPFPHARSVDALDALAAWRGASVGLAAAEAFMVVRSVWE